MAAIEIVDHDRLVAGLDQQLHGVGPDITCPPVTNTFIRLFPQPRICYNHHNRFFTPTEGCQRRRPWTVANPRRRPDGLQTTHWSPRASLSIKPCPKRASRMTRIVAIMALTAATASSSRRSTRFSSRSRGRARLKRSDLKEKSIEFLHKLPQVRPGPKARCAERTASSTTRWPRFDASTADGIVLAAPVNFFTVTALMKRFIERLLVYVYWPWGKSLPKPRVKKCDKKAVIMTASLTRLCSGWLAAQSDGHDEEPPPGCSGPRSCKLYFGMVCGEEKQRLTPSQVKKAQAGRLLARTAPPR